MGGVLRRPIEVNKSKRGELVKKWTKHVALLAILVGVFLGLGSSAGNAASSPMTTGSSTSQVAEKPADAVVGDPGVLEQFGPPGVLVSTLLGGLLLVFRSINEGKKIDVTTYKERAAEAEARSNEEIGKVHKKLAELEKKLDNVIEDRDDYRDTLEERKAAYTSQVIELEQRHQRELEDMHNALMIEVRTRHALERLLAEKGIKVPTTQQPYTVAMQDAAQKEVDSTEQALKVIRDNE